MNTIKTFYKANSIQINLNKQDTPRGAINGSEIPSKEEVLKIVQAAGSNRSKAAILCLKDSGIRESDLVKLRWSQVVDYGEGFWGFGRLESQKNKKTMIPFIGPEATDALKNVTRKGDIIFPCDPKTLSFTLGREIKRTGIKTPISGHGLRKFHHANLQTVCPEKFVLVTEGKAVTVYDETRPDKLVEAYKKGYDALRILGSVPEAIKKDMDTLREENKDLRRRIDQIQENRRESDSDLDKLFKDPEVQALLKQKMRQLNS